MTITKNTYLEKTFKRLDKFYLGLAYLSGVSLCLLLAVILYNVLSRLTSSYLGGATDFAGYFMAIATFFALPYTFRSHGHIAVSLIIDFCGKKARRIFQLFSLVVMFLCLSFLTFYFYRLVNFSYQFQEKSQGAYAVSLWIPQSALFIGSLFFTFAVLQTLIQECLVKDSFFGQSFKTSTHL